MTNLVETTGTHHTQPSNTILVAKCSKLCRPHGRAVRIWSAPTDLGPAYEGRCHRAAYWREHLIAYEVGEPKVVVVLVPSRENGPTRGGEWVVSGQQRRPTAEEQHEAVCRRDGGVWGAQRACRTFGRAPSRKRLPAAAILGVPRLHTRLEQAKREREQAGSEDRARKQDDMVGCQAGSRTLSARAARTCFLSGAQTRNLRAKTRVEWR